ncbi:hypothetical protein BMS3Bbin12_00168 [bacterium BMS3Bbin12]|nr:hypothetical protein BMS3Bbin12_00168 [bacterium BMS3Bbin12]GBE50479.1 hypothetical protein BMS3Bbin13_01419 [bacterium BMS3Bbin13]
MKLVIPESYHNSIKKLNELSDAVLVPLCDALLDAPPSFVVEDLVSHIKSKAKLDINDEDLGEIVGVSVAMYYIWSIGFNKLNHNEFAARVALAAKGIDSGRDWSTLEKNAILLLGLDKPIGVTAKALDLMRDFQHVVADIRIITDSRPVFAAEDSDNSPVAVMTTHVLKVMYIRDNKLESFYAAMDCNDIRHLQATLERALKKEASLQRLARKDEIFCLDARALEDEE